MAKPYRHFECLYCVVSIDSGRGRALINVFNVRQSVYEIMRNILVSVTLFSFGPIVWLLTCILNAQMKRCQEEQ